MASERVREAAEKLVAEVDKLVLDPRVYVKLAMQNMLCDYPSVQQEQEALKLIEASVVQAVTICAQWDLAGAKEFLFKINREVNRLMIPPPARYFSDELAEWMPSFEKAMWHAREIECLSLSVAKPSERIVVVSVHGITLRDGDSTDAPTRTVMRSDVHDRVRPAWQTKEQWQATGDYQELRRAYVSAVAADRERLSEQVVRVSAGPAHMIGQEVVEQAQRDEHLALRRGDS